MKQGFRGIEVKKDNKTYSTEVHLLYYDFIVKQVSTAVIPQLLNSVAERLGLNINPGLYTIEQMTRELGLICEMQVAETLLNNKDCTIGFDATIQDGVHINCIHLCTQSTTQVITLGKLA